MIKNKALILIATLNVALALVWMIQSKAYDQPLCPKSSLMCHVGDAVFEFVPKSNIAKSWIVSNQGKEDSYFSPRFFSVNLVFCLLGSLFLILLLIIKPSQFDGSAKAAINANKVYEYSVFQVSLFSFVPFFCFTYGLYLEPTVFGQHRFASHLYDNPLYVFREVALSLIVIFGTYASCVLWRAHFLKNQEF